MVNKYGIGERVLVRPDAHRIEGAVGFSPIMKQYLGKVYEILNITRRDTYVLYQLVSVGYKNDIGKFITWNFDECWLEPENTVKIEENDFMDVFK